jgi:hypothetical protein
MTKSKITTILPFVFLLWLLVSIVVFLTATVNRTHLSRPVDESRFGLLTLTSTVSTGRSSGVHIDSEFKALATTTVWHGPCLPYGRTEKTMLKISVVDGRNRCRLVLEGRLVAPWVDELRTAWNRAKAEFDGRELVIDMENVMVVSQEAENTLLQMMNEGARFRCSGVLTKHVLHQLKRRSQKNPEQAEMGDQKGQK